MEKSELIDLIKKSDLGDEVKNGLTELVEKEGATESVVKQVLTMVNRQVKSLEKDVKRSRKRLDGLKEGIDLDKIMMNLIYLKMLQRMSNAYAKYKKGMGQLENELDSVFDEAVNQAEEVKKEEIKKSI